jgi:hypothetical protein
VADDASITVWESCEKALSMPVPASGARATQVTDGRHFDDWCTKRINARLIALSYQPPITKVLEAKWWGRNEMVLSNFPLKNIDVD